MSVELHEDNQAVCYILAGVTSRPPSMMAELRKRWHLRDENGIRIRSRYIRSAGNEWADMLSNTRRHRRLAIRPSLIRGTQLPLRPTQYRLFRVSTQPTTTPLYRRLARPFLRGGRRASTPIFISTHENNWGNPMWPLLANLVFKMRHSGELSIGIAPR
jgi:hypothetical protein